MPAWRPEAFLASLDPSTLSPVLTARLAGSTATSAAALYAAFVESPNFAFWFKQRRAPVLHLVEDEVGGWVGGRMRSVSLLGRQAYSASAPANTTKPVYVLGWLNGLCCAVLCRGVCRGVCRAVCLAVLCAMQPESDEDEDGFSKVAPGGGDSSDTAGVQSDPDEVELVQQLLSTEQVRGLLTDSN